MTTFSRLRAGAAAALLTLAAFVLPLGAGAQINQPACNPAASVCTSAEVGPFLQGITVACGNVGNCELTDIMLVVANVGNWILGIVGSLVFLFYVWGGIDLLTSGGNPTRISKGKDRMKKATIGLLIVFGAFLFIRAVEGILRQDGSGVGNYVNCQLADGSTVNVLQSVCDQLQLSGE